MKLPSNIAPHALAQIPPPPGCDEKVFQAYAVRLGRAIGWRCYHTRWSMGSDVDYPDLTMVHETQRRQLWLELKKENAKPPTPGQLEWGRIIIASGGEWHWFRPSQWDEVVKILRGELFSDDKR